MPPSIQVVGLGLATLDVFVRLKEMPTWGRFGVFDDFRIEGGGMAATAMVAAARLGLRAGFVGIAGSGYAGRLLLESIADRGVDVRGVRQRPAPESRVVMVYVDEAGERHFSSLRSWGDDWLRPDELDREYFTSADFLHVDGFHFGAAVEAARWMHEAGKKVVYDAAKTICQTEINAPELLKHVDYLICGSGFAPALTGERDRGRAGRAALAMGPGVVVMTEGAEGSTTVTPREEFHTPAFAVTAVDTTGAGDVFHGAYIVGLAHGWPLRDVATFASAAAAIKCTKLGGRAGIPTFDEVMAFLGERGIIISPR
jgi:sugar/nucleoside kinase (ribokinase family)